ncbi:glutathione peroxidase [Rhodovulum sp. BSW8]|uniref:Glutathione peroxidase n=1 Tax=Rhodovulum visakhapatnamense TaxID=364297 RepID=A0A4R8FBX1_9RHOB|nr:MULTISPECIES: glutathione peroxidase [Rhodovulum]OLS44172.1 glutathione peroxidase [Rhodovulum sulfidophilum]MBL3571438.1 glutathione peroxidase [Rhodovulum visakhapatnamense]MBL3578517.1 glutathione peroxidase [Rhodovulum visakhapatnamense]RBO54244.1 glutathione peroxidase [Rhodovulum sp. BSW8]TDX23250.1 glutathione peroxidase [Rhodovulum visakhapatnamense]
MRPAILPVVAAVLLCAGPGAADGFRFASIDGGEIDLSAFHGQPVLVVNTASQCGFTPQYDGLQALQDRYGPRGLVVLAVPSDDFNQELADEAAVKEFCEVNFGLTLPMTEITHVKGPEAHPFYRWMAEAHGFTPGWNFNKVLLDGEGSPVATYGAFTTPKSAKLTARIESLLPE